MIDIGAEFDTVDGTSWEVIGARDEWHIFVVSEYGTKKTITRTQYQARVVEDKNRPVVYGVGYIGYGRHRAALSGPDSDIFSTWLSLCSEYKDDMPKEWRCYQAFAEWAKSTSTLRSRATDRIQVADAPVEEDAYDKDTILDALNRNRWSRAKAAKDIGLTHGALIKKMQEYRI